MNNLLKEENGQNTENPGTAVVNDSVLQIKEYDVVTCSNM